MKKLLSVLLAVCMVFSMITVSAVSVGAADVGKGASTGASEKTIYVGIINYLTLKESDYQVHYWNNAASGDAALTATGETVQQAVGSAYWNNAAQTFKMYTATIPAEATGYKLHNGDTWFGQDGDTAKNNTAYLFEYGGKHYAYYTTTEEPATEATEATTVAPVTRDHHFYVDFTEVIASGTTWYAWTWGEKSTGEWRPVEKFGYVSCHENVLFASFAADTAPNWDSALSQTEDFTVEDDGRLRVLNEKDEQGHYKVKWNTEEPSTAAPATEAPTTVEPATDAPARLADGYYLIGIKGWDVASIDAAQKFTENPGAEDEYLLETTLAENDTIKVVKVEKDVITDWYPDGTENEYKVDKAHSGEVTIYFQTTEKADWKEFGGYFYVAAPEVPTEEPTTEAPATEVPATEAPTTVEPATDAPARLADGYYLIGIKGWDVDSIDAAQKFTENPGAEDEYLLETTLAENDTIKVVKVEKDVITEWYPDGTENEYKVDKAHSGDVTIYFQTTEKADWKEFSGYFYVAAPEAPTDEPATEEPATDAPTTEVKEIELTGDYYLVGFIDGKDSYGTDHPFKDGKATITTSEASYFIVTDGTNYFMTKGWQGEVTEATLYNSADLGTSADKLMAPAGTVTFTLKAYSDGTFKLSYTVEEAPTTEAPTTVEPATDAPARLADGYYLIGIKGWDVDSIDAAQKFTENPGAEDEYQLETTLAENDTIKVVKVEKDVITEWYPDGTENEYKVDKAHSGDVTIYFQTTEKADWKEFGGYFYVAAPEVPTEEPTTEAPATEVPATEAPTTVEPATDAPARLADGYYLIGIKGWDVDSIDAAQKFTENPGAEDEYLLETTLAENDTIKVVKVEKDVITEWYPDGTGNEYKVDKAHSGDVTIYFQTTEKADWKEFGGYFYVAAPEVPTDEPATEAPATDAPVTEAPATDAPATEVQEIELTGDYYLVGFIDGKDSYGTDHPFKDGKATITTSEASYFIVTDGTNYFMTKGWQGEVTEATLYNSADLGTSADKLMAPAGTVTFTLKAYSDGTFKLSYTVDEAPATDAPATETPATDAPARLADGYYLIGIKGWDVDSIDAAQKFTENPGAEDEYLLETTLAENDTIKVVKVEKDVITDWYPDGTENEYKVDKAHSGDVTIYFQTTEKADWKEFGGYFYVAAPEAPTDEPATEAPATEEPGTEPATDAPAKLADGYYLIGIKGWDVDSIDAAQKFTENPGAEDEYLLETTLAENDTIKVVKVEKDVITEWYPDGTGNEYMVDKAHSGDVTIYFQTTEKADWKEFGGYFYVAAPEVPTEEPTTEAPATEAPATEAPVTDAPATEAPTTEVQEIELTGDYYLVGFIDGKDSYGTDHPFKDGKATITTSEASYFIVTDGTNYFMTKGWQGEVTEATLYNSADLGTSADKLMAPAGTVTFTLKAYSDGTFKLSYTVDEAPATEAPTTVEPATDAPARLSDGYYLIGIKGWNVASIDATQKFTENPGAEDEYLLETTLAENDTIKVVKVEKDVITEWYPDGTGNEYKVDKAHSGDVTIYFQTTKKADWKEFGGYFYVAAPEAPTDEPATEAPATEVPTTVEPATDAPARLADGYYLIGIKGWDVDSIDAAQKFTENPGAEDEYLLETTLAENDTIKVVKVEKDVITEWYPDGTGNEYKVDKAHSGEVTIYFQTTEKADWKEFGGYFYVAAPEAPTDEPATEEPGTEPATDAPAKLADGYYLIGIKGWDVDSIDAAQKFTENPGAEDEYLLETTLAENDTIKVVKVEKDVIAEWYPDGTGNEYKVDKAHSGEVTIYFQTAEKADWKEFGGYFYVAAPEAPTDEPATEEPATDAPTTDVQEIELTGDYYLVGYIDGKDSYGTDHPFKDGKATITTSEASYFIVTDGTNYFMTKGWLGEVTEATLYNSADLGTSADKLMAPAGTVTFTLKAYSDGTFKLSYTVEEAPATEEPATEEPGTEPPTGDEGYYLVGNMTGWKVDSSYKLTKNDGAEAEEYMLEDVDLKTTDAFKVVYSKDGSALTKWYPDLVEDFGKNGEIEKDGTYTVYFRPNGDGDESWFYNVIQIVAAESPDEPLIGDVDGNGRVTIEDATMLQRYLAEFIDLTDDQKARADVTEDGRLSIKDVTAIQRMIAELPYK